MLSRYFGTSVAIDRNEVELSTIQKELGLTDKQWETLPVMAKLKIRNLLEQLMRKEADAENKSRPSLKDPNREGNESTEDPQE